MTELVETAAAYVQRCFERYLPEGFFYHNLEHTQAVVDGCRDMAQGLSTQDGEALCLAAWFHDIGYLSSLEEHEAHSITWWRAFVLERDLPQPLLAQVIRCIEATKLGSTPADRLSAYLAEADLAYSLAQDAFEVRGNALRREWALLLNRQYSDEEWAALQKQFVQQAVFETDYGKKYFQPKLELLQRHWAER